MRILPYDHFTLKTSVTIPELIHHLETRIEEPKIWEWRSSGTHAPYRGTLSPDGFKIQRVIHYRNSFLPQIRGRFEALPDGTAVHITLSLHPFVSSFLLFWGSSWLSISLLFLFSALFSDNVGLDTLTFIPFPIMVLFFFWLIFWFEADRDRQDLTQMITTLHQ
ncbi:hypothetical protein [Roseofilum capinflatum]|uniref:Uncharacterized protein n=1 Tax=Roseofilum capinflatum BLCC-M114 TaxID=3022440 RepID=A0ABT7BB89_9CYAN|nr:hypothetical protein [Roseofilum capinflatum]MDJ1176443.1 hypothetical protein [Roseofilum capinflatum BLCC-M114]